MGVWYCTREDVKRALDIADTARSNRQIDRAIESGSRTIEGRLHRRFYPQLATRSWDWPNGQYARPWRLWLDDDELISITTLTVGGVTIAPADYMLRRSDGKDEPPFSHVEINLAGSAAFGGGSTHQRNIAITGPYGHSADTGPAGALAEPLDASETGVDVTDSGLVGVGDILLIDTERMIVTGRSMFDTGQNIGADLTASNAAVTVAVTTGSAYAVDEVLLVDAERMLIVDIAGNNVIVKRAWDGSVLAAHTTGAAIYAPRTLTVTRGALGTTAATHLTAAAIVRHLVPGTVRDLNVALALTQGLQEQSGYARTAGSNESQRQVFGRALKAAPGVQAGRGLQALWDDAYTAYGRMARTRAV